MSLDTILVWLPFILVPYLIYKRYRTSMSLIPPSPFYRYLATKPVGALRIIGGIILAIAAVIYYLADDKEMATRGTFTLVAFLALIGLFLTANPGYLLNGAYLYNEDEDRWRELKQDAINDLKKNYWKVVFRRLGLVALLIAVLWLLPTF